MSEKLHIKIKLRKNHSLSAKQVDKLKEYASSPLGWDAMILHNHKHDELTLFNGCIESDYGFEQDEIDNEKKQWKNDPVTVTINRNCPN